MTFRTLDDAKDLAGKAATFDIVVGEVKKPGETKLNDDFAKSLGLESLEQLTGWNGRREKDRAMRTAS